MLDKSQLNYLPKTPRGADTNTSAAEIEKFDRLAKEWWNPKGKYKRVMDFNQCRWGVIETQLKGHFGNKIGTAQLTAVDIGSGGGLLCEPLSQIGFQVTGVDASEMSINVAKRHALQTGLDIHYRHCLSTELLEEGQTFDVVMNTEVIEHVPDQQQLINECCQLLKPGGLLVLATLNRTIKSFVFGIVGAEYVLRLLPIGTHDWKAFVKPSEIGQMLKQNHCQSTFITGVSFNPLTGNWSQSKATSVNYLMFGKRD